MFRDWTKGLLWRVEGWLIEGPFGGVRWYCPAELRAVSHSDLAVATDEGLRSWDSSKTFLSCGLNSLHFCPKRAFAGYPMHFEYHPNALPWPAGFCPLLRHHEPHNFLFQVHEKVLPLLRWAKFVTTPGPLHMLAPSPGTLATHISPDPSHPAQPHSHIISIPARQMRPRCYSLLYHHVLFLHSTYHSFQSYSPGVSLLNILLPLSWQQSLLTSSVSLSPSTGPDA